MPSIGIYCQYCGAPLAQAVEAQVLGPAPESVVNFDKEVVDDWLDDAILQACIHLDTVTAACMLEHRKPTADETRVLWIHYQNLKINEKGNEAAKVISERVAQL